MAKGKPRRTDLEANAIEVLRAIEEPHRSTIFREVGRGTEDEAVAVIVAEARAEYGNDIASSIPVPSEIGVAPARVAAYRAHMLRVATDVHEKKGPLPSVDAAFPELMRTPVEHAQAALEEMPSLLDKKDELQNAKVAASEAKDLEGEDPPVNISRLRERVRRLTNLSLGLLAAEFAVSARIWAGYSGLLDEHGEPTFRAWIMVFCLSLASTIGSTALAHFTWQWVKKLPVANKLSRAANLALPILGLSFATSLAVVRFAGDLGEEQLSGVIQFIGALAVAVISFVLSVITPFVLVIVHDERRRLTTEIEEAEGASTLAERSKAKWTEAEAEIEREIARCLAETEAPDKIRETYALGLHAILKHFADRDEHLLRLAIEARSAFRLLSSMTPAMRDAVRTTVTTLRDIDADGARASAIAKATSVLVLLVALVLGGSACRADEVASPTAFAFVCDGTGAAPALGCTHEVLERAFVSFARGSRVPRSTFLVVTTAGSYAETKVALRLEVPKPSRGKRGEHEAWIRKSLPALHAVAIPSDDVADKRRNQSDELAALAVAMREVAALPKHRRTLVLAGDGWSIGSNVNLTRNFGPPQKILDGARRAGLVLSAEIFDEVTLCGFHHEGQTAAAVAGRDAFWRELFPNAEVLTTCAELFPSVPEPLRPAAGAHAPPAPGKEVPTESR